MKATKLLLAAVLFTGITSLSFAGPGVDYWNRMTEAAKNRAAVEAKAKNDSSTNAKPAIEIAASCATCSCCAKKA